MRGGAGAIDQMMGADEPGFADHSYRTALQPGATAGNGGAVAILNRNEPAFYCVPAEEYEAMLNLIEDAELNAIADARMNSPEIAVSLDDL